MRRHRWKISIEPCATYISFVFKGNLINDLIFIEFYGYIFRFINRDRVFKIAVTDQFNSLERSGQGVTDGKITRIRDIKFNDFFPSMGVTELPHFIDISNRILTPVVA